MVTRSACDLCVTYAAHNTHRMFVLSVHVCINVHSSFCKAWPIVQYVVKHTYKDEIKSSLRLSVLDYLSFN